MEKDCYTEIIEEVSNKLAEKVTTEEKDLAARATQIDGDIAGIIQKIGLRTTEKVIKKTCDEIIEKKSEKD